MSKQRVERSYLPESTAIAVALLSVTAIFVFWQESRWYRLLYFFASGTIATIYATYHWIRYYRVMEIDAPAVIQKLDQRRFGGRWRSDFPSRYLFDSWGNDQARLESARKVALAAVVIKVLILAQGFAALFL